MILKAPGLVVWSPTAVLEGQKSPINPTLYLLACTEASQIALANAYELQSRLHVFL